MTMAAWNSDWKAKCTDVTCLYSEFILMGTSLSVTG
jgi:hypothetical protein